MGLERRRERKLSDRWKMTKMKINKKKRNKNMKKKMVRGRFLSVSFF